MLASKPVTAFIFKALNYEMRVGLRQLHYYICFKTIWDV
jgi:hypothetical protein